MTLSDRIPATLPRAALVTGGAQRIGRAIALALAEAGFAVALHCHTSVAAAETTSADIRNTGGRCVVLRADLANEAEVVRLLPQAIAALGPIGVLVNNASPFERDEWHDATRASWDAHIEPGLRAPFVLMQHFARALPADAEGAVINMLDQRVWSITPHFVSYTVAKAGLWALTQSMALALAPRIRVNGIGPGPALPNTRQTRAAVRPTVRLGAARPRHRSRRDCPRRACHPCPAGDDGPDAGTRRRPAPAMAACPPHAAARGVTRREE